MKKILAMMLALLLAFSGTAALAATTPDQIDKWKLAYYENGDLEAAVEVGECYYEGDGIEKNEKEAVKWFTYAAEGGFVGGQHNLGVCYNFGYGVDINYEEAAKWFHLAAEQGSKLSQYNLGVMYKNGQGVEKNPEEGVKWYRLSAEQGCALAQFGLGVSYANGSGVEKNIDEAIKWYKLAAEQGDENAINALKDLNISVATATPAPTATPKPTATPTPTPKPTATPKANEWLLIDDGKLKIEIKSFLFQQFSSGTSTLYMYADVENNTGRTINIHLNDAYINGVESDGVGMMEVEPGTRIKGDGSDDYFFFKPLTEGVDSHLRDPNTLRFEVDVNEDDTYEDLYTFTVSIDGPESMKLVTPTPTKSSSSSSSLPNLAKQFQKITANYPYLCKGDKGEDVRKLQQRLISLGYLNDSADGIYGSNTAQAVYDFRDQNGLTNVSDRYAADNEMQKVLFGSSAKYFTEPYYGLVIPPNGYGQWEKVSNNRMNMRVKVKNITRTKTIKAFELYMYATDIYGDRIYGEDIIYRATTTKKISPGSTVYSDYMTLPNRNQIDQVHVAIKRIVYTDGTVRENFSPDYFYWNIKW